MKSWIFNTDEIKLYPNPCHSILNIEYDGSGGL